MATDILVKVGADISDFSRKMADSNRALENFSKANKQTFDAFKQTGAAVTGAGVAIAAGLGGAVKIAANFEAEMSKVGAISGATGDELAVLSDKAREMGSKTKFSASESAQAFQYMAMAGWKTTDMLDGIEGIMSLAAASGEDLALTSDIVTDALTAFGMSAADSGKFADILAAASSNANTNVAMLGESFKYVAPLAGSLGYSAEDVSVALGLMANAGIKSSQAGTSLKTMLANLAKPTKQMKEQMDKLGISLTDSKGQMKPMSQVIEELRGSFANLSETEKASAAATLFGKEAMAGALAVINASESDYQKLTEAINNSEGAAKEMADAMQDNLMGALTNLSSAFEEIMISIGTALLPAVKFLVGALQSLADWFNGLSDSTKSFIAIGAAVASILMLIVGPILLLIGFIPSIISGFMTVATVVKAVGAAMAFLTSPISLVIAAVIGLAFLIYKYWDEIKAFTIEAWGAIKDFFAELWTSIKETASTAWEGIKTFFSDLWTSIVEMTSTAWQGLVDVVMAIVQPFIDGITNIFNGMKDGLQTIWDGLKTYFTGVWELIKNIFLGAVLLIFNLVTGNFEELRSNAKAIWENIKNALNTIWEGIKKIFSGALSAIWGGVKAAWENIKSNTKSVFETAKSIIKSIWNGIKTFFTETLVNIWNTTKQKFTDILNAIRDKMNDVKSKVESGWNKAKAFLEGIDLMKIGKDIIQGLINGIKSKVEAVGRAVKDVADKITGKIKGILGIASPSKVLAQIGRWTGEGLAKGIVQTTGLVGRATAKLADAATPDAPAISLAYDTPSGIRSSLASAVNGTVDVNARDDMIAAAIDNLSRKLENMRIEMDRREMGRFVSDVTTEDRNSAVRGRGHRRL